MAELRPGGGGFGPNVLLLGHGGDEATVNAGQRLQRTGE